MIEILETRTVTDIGGAELSRHVDIIITSGPNSYLYSVGGLPLTGNLQTVLDAREAELFAKAQAGGRVVDLYEISTKRALRAFALVMLDEINVLRQASLPPLPVRSASQIEGALKAKIKGLA